MIERLANVLYWTACGIAGLILLASAFVAATVFYKWEALGVMAGGAIVAGLVYLVGRAIRYVLVGR